MNPLAKAIDLLICCAGVDPEKGAKLEALISKGVDWNLVIEQGHRHGILPLLYWSLKTHNQEQRLAGFLPSL